jgi:hypothetical protein
MDGHDYIEGEIKMESALEISRHITASKRRYGTETEGNPVILHDRVKSYEVNDAKASG